MMPKKPTSSAVELAPAQAASPPATSGKTTDDRGALLDSLLEQAPGDPSVRWTRETRAGYALQLREEDGTEGLRIVAPGGQLCVQIRLEAGGPRIDVFGAELHAHASDVVRLEGRRVEIEGTEAITLTTRGDIHQRAEGYVRSEAFEHHIEATHGEVRLVANDDVALDGERIRLNSPPQVRPPHLTRSPPRPPRPPEENGQQ